MKNGEASGMHPGERLLVSLTMPPWCAVYLFPAGFSIFPIHRLFFGGRSGPTLGVVFFGVLLMLRFGPAVVRRFLPVSKEVQTGWFRNRMLAKRYDLYQWQKLLWVGLGVLGYAAVFRGLRGTPMVLAAVCLIAGGIAAIAWREKRLAMQAGRLSPG